VTDDLKEFRVMAPRLLAAAARAAVAASTIALAAVPAAAQGWSAPGPSAVGAPSHVGGGVAVHRGGDWRRGDGRDHGGHHDRWRHRRGDRVLVLNHWGWGGDVDRDPGAAWRPDSYNDWWHEQPWRSYPRWVQKQGEDCPPERRWQGGGAWRCGW
jgi:hypothetical protein